MGEQGAKSLRGGKMEDVIFAGTAGRPPLGRAEVTLTIDNTDGALPIDYTEVTISRTMFRSGGSEYAINGTACRLLDVQELLSDSGRPRDARHRRAGPARHGPARHARGAPRLHRGGGRRPQAPPAQGARAPQARDDGGQPHPGQDLTGEIRRQLGPLGRQAEAARRAAVIQADARDARLRLLADDLVQLTAVLEQEVADETALLERRTAVEDGWPASATASASSRPAAEAAARAGAGPGALRPLACVTERLTGRSLAPERVRLLGSRTRSTSTTPARRDPEELRAPGRPLRARQEALRRRDADAKAELAAAVAARRRPRPPRGGAGRLARLARAVADRREGLARLAGQVGASRSRIEAGEAEIGRLRDDRRGGTARAAEAEQEFARSRAASPWRRRARRGSTPPTSGPPRTSRLPRRRSRSCATRSATPSATGRRPPPASRRWR